jgi:hypothetical protein
VDALSRLYIDSLKIHEEDVLTLLSRSENNSISNIKFPMDTVLIFKEQAKVKEPRFREKGLKDTIIEMYYKEYCPGNMNICFIWDRLEQKRLSGIP